MDFAPEITDIMETLFEGVYRYRVAYGGRSSAKSYGFADAALEVLVENKNDIVVCREFKTTIAESVHKLLKKRIAHHKLTHLFDITINSITYLPTGSKLTYMHLHDNETEVKGLEGNTICWIFEAHNLSKESWKYLNPTIRRTPTMNRDPEFWIEFNPEYADDFVYSEFIESDKENCKCLYLTYLDNPVCPQDQIELAEQERRNSEDEYNHIWLGLPRKTGGLVYPMFDPDVHIRDVSLERIEPVANFFMGQDPHTVYYPFCIWLGREPRGDGTFNYYIYNEYPMLSSRDFNDKYYWELRKEKKCALTLNQRATLYKILDNTITSTVPSIEITARGIDTRFAKGAGTGSTTNNTRGIIVEMADPANGGISFECPPEYMIDSQRERIKELLSYDKNMPITAFNEPRMYVSPHCKNVIDAFKFHRFDRDGKEREDEKRKDPMDAVRIAMATEQQHKHKNKYVEENKFDKQAPDAVSNLRSAFMGKESLVRG
jgi:PBSX family phage terminase large subunit